jgi:hypothetical protein
MRSAYLQNRAYMLKINDTPPLNNTIEAKEAEAALTAQDNN